MNTNTGGLAFPSCSAAPHGMTMRQWYAGQAMAALIAGDYEQQNAADLVNGAVEYADAMIARLDPSFGVPPAEVPKPRGPLGGPVFAGNDFLMHPVAAHVEPRLVKVTHTSAFYVWWHFASGPGGGATFVWQHSLFRSRCSRVPPFTVEAERDALADTLRVLGIDPAKIIKTARAAL